MISSPIVCVIDDDSIYRFTIVRTLEIQQVAGKIITFSDGEEGIQFILDNLNEPDKLPDIIFLDINMPIMDGWQFLEAYESMREKLNKRITIYLVTSSIDPADIDRAKGILSITQYLTKPINPALLKGFIEIGLAN